MRTFRCLKSSHLQITKLNQIKVSRNNRSTLLASKSLTSHFPSAHYTTNNTNADDSQNQPRMAITFTCKICESRLSRTFLKQSYEKGVVLIKCPKCLNHHIIADNLKWFSDLQGKKCVKSSFKYEKFD